MRSKTISVIVPIYKVESYLDRCVQSLVDQTYPQLEIVLVDDGSPDRCGAMCDEWAKKDSRIKVVHKPNGGLSDARNAGMEAATGEVIGFVDSDDWVAADMYEKLLQALEQDGSDIAACGVGMVWEDDTPSRMLTHDFVGVLTREQAQAALLEETHLLQPVWYKLYRRDIVEGLPFAVGKYHEDAFWSYQAIGRAQSVSVIPDVGYYYLQRAGSIMGASYSLKRLDAIEAACERQQYFKKHFPELADAACVKLHFLLLYHGQLAMRYLTGEQRREALNRLKAVRGQFPLNASMRRSLSASEKLWMRLEAVSFVGTCKLRNTAKIGI